MKARNRDLLYGLIALTAGIFLGGVVFDGGLGVLGLVLLLATALAAMVVSIAQLAYPRGKRHSVFAGGVGLLSATALVVAAGLLYDSATRESDAWGLLAGGAVGAAVWVAWVYARAFAASRNLQEPAAQIGESDVPEGVDAETVEFLFEQMQKLVDAEDARAQSLNARATGLGAFGAIIAALLVPAARDLGDAQGADPATASVVLLASSAILLVAGVLGVLLGVLVARQVAMIAISEVRLWETLPFVTKDVTWARGRLLVTLRKALVSERRVNNHKAQWLTASAALVATGVLCAAAGGLTLLL